MRQVVIENPIINSPFDEPARHFRFTDEGITNEEVDGRRASSYFVPIAKPKKKGKQQLQFETEWTQDRIEENKLVNDIRRRVAAWRQGGYVASVVAKAMEDISALRERRANRKQGPNQPRPCGSGKKAKHCWRKNH